MTERLLQYIWQYQYYNKNFLNDTNGESLQIIQQGICNTNQGPDFTGARIRIGNTTWAGSIELHIRTSDWQQHKHSDDHNYNNVILHVVWINDIELNLPFPTLELQTRVSKLLLDKYDDLMQVTQFIPCEKQIKHVDDLTLVSWKERLLIERLQSRSLHIISLLQQNNQHWEETFWWLLARNFGININSDAFEKMAKSISLNILSKQRHQLQHLEAMLMGQAGLLEKNFKDEYPLLLQKEYRFLQRKYKLEKTFEPVYFLRMRPAAFPVIRLSQLAVLISKNKHLFAAIKETNNFPEAEDLFHVEASGYWNCHYVFDERSPYKIKVLGKQMVWNILINTVIPVLYAYGHINKDEKYRNRALGWMGKIPGESNNITKAFTGSGIESKTAFDSQALIQLKKEYCDRKRCLQCAIGNKILKGL